ncbi:biotin synthase auxiliary protein BsaP [Paenarthrobacter aurescens]|uniref:biotin synthase auxiliary protein BsaP n=1 Tax=Paenarthrobacter aurescens TaxID=43663 RepID=UPI0011414F02
MIAEAPQLYCGHCGGSALGDGAGSGDGPTSDAHHRCQQQLAMEPPRFCPQCRRRMKVQVTPLGWTAECSRHGLTGFCTDTAPKPAS